MEQKRLSFEPNFDINRVSFENVSTEFENKFREHYREALNRMSSGDDCLDNASGANTLGFLEKMAQHIKRYDKTTDFDNSYNQIQKEFEPFTET